MRGEAGSGPLRTLILGVGNPVRGDDGAGILVVRRLAAEGLPAGCQTEELHGDWLALLDLLGACERLVVVDAVDLDLRPGEVVELAPPARASVAAPATGHAFGLADVLALAADLGIAPPDAIHLVGIQIGDAAAPGDRCSPPVEAALPAACALVRSLALAGR